MVSIREIRRIFENVAPERQLPMSAIVQFQTRAGIILKGFAELCDEAAGVGTNVRLTSEHVKLAFVKFNDENEDEDMEEWNE
jgi:hypothetical protein